MTSRRRFLTIAAGAGAAAALGPARAGAPLSRWQGVALGARASVAIAHPRADRLIAAARAEIDRLEDIFSLYRAGSALSRLNAAGRLAAPPIEMVSLLSEARRVHAETGGAFDPTVQPLWRLWAERAARGTQPGEAEIAALPLGFDHVRVDPAEIAFARPGMALTLNGIAQGFVADRVAALLAREGLTDALIETGEVVGLGHRPDGAPWQAGIAAPDGRQVARAALTGRALATSAPSGTLLDAAGTLGHIIDPRTRRPGGRWRLISVSAPRAWTADALSTALCLMGEAEGAAALAAFPGARLVHRS